MEVTPEEASEAGQVTIDNVETLYDEVFAAMRQQNLIAGIDAFLPPDGDGQALFSTLARNHTAVTPCLYGVAYSLAHNDLAAPRDANYAFVARSRRTPIKPLPPEKLALFRVMLPRLLKTTLRLHEAGVTLLAGTDVAADRIPGFQAARRKGFAGSGWTEPTH